MKKTIYYALFLLSLGLLIAREMGEETKTIDPKPASNLTASSNGLEVSLTWDAPDFLSIVALEERFETQDLPAFWQNIDQDGDGNLWGFREDWLDGDNTSWIGSWSWIFGETITPDNWLITPKITVPPSGILSFNIGALNPAWMNDTYAVYLSQTNSNIESFDVELIKENLSNPIRTRKTEKSSTESRALFMDRSIDLKEYAGKEIYLAFRHFESKNEFCILLDNVLLKGSDPDAVTPEHSFNIYRNGELVANSTDTNWKEALEQYGTYEYEIEVKYANGELSPKISKTVHLVDPNASAYIILEAHDVWQDGTGYQILLDNTASAYGNTIPSAGPLTDNCSIWDALIESFSHFAPLDAEISCSPLHWIVDGVSEKVAIPAGTYDFCVVNPEPGVKIWIAAGENARKDNYLFEAGKTYRFIAEINPNDLAHDHILISIEDPGSMYNPVNNLTGSADEESNVALSWEAPTSQKGTTPSNNGKTSSYSYSITCNGEAIVAGLSENSYTHENVADGNYEYCVIVNYEDGGNSAPSCIDVKVGKDYAPVSNLDGTYLPSSNKVLLSWMYPVTNKRYFLNEGFENGIPDNWKSVDNDGDGRLWKVHYFEGHNSYHCISSASYDHVTGSISPDNWLITPKLIVSEDTQLTYSVSAQDDMYPNETYGIFISKSGDQIDNFDTEIFKETLSNKNSLRHHPKTESERGRLQGYWYSRTVTIPKGTKYIAFRHYDCSNQFWINLDNIKIYAHVEDEPTEDCSYNIYRDRIFMNNVSTEYFEDLDPIEGIHKYEVEVKYADGGLSPKAFVNVSVNNLNPTEGNAMVYLKAGDIWGDGSGYQMYLDNSASEYGNAIPETGPLVNGCDIPAGLSDKFSHRIPIDADISCSPAHQVVAGELGIAIPAGSYDFCVVNGQEGVSVWIAGGIYGRQDNFYFEDGKGYHFEVEKTQYGDNVNLLVIHSVEQIESQAKAYGSEGCIIIELEQSARVNIYDLHGRRILSEQVSGRAEIPCQAGIYVVQLGKELSQKVIVN